MSSYSRQAIIFSLNGTLAANGQSIDAETARLLIELLDTKKVIIASGCSMLKFETRLLSRFGMNHERFANLFLLPLSGSKLMTWKGSWVESYSELLSSQQKDEIFSALDRAQRIMGLTNPSVSYGSIIQDYDTQITFSGLGENAPAELKAEWDPKRHIRERMLLELKRKIPGYDIRIGGMTSIDITRRGVNKGYGIRKLEELLKLQPETMIFVGDAIYSDGNDFPIKAAGINYISVKSSSETKELLKSWAVGI